METPEVEYSHALAFGQIFNSLSSVGTRDRYWRWAAPTLRHIAALIDAVPVELDEGSWTFMYDPPELQALGKAASEWLESAEGAEVIFEAESVASSNAPPDPWFTEWLASLPIVAEDNDDQEERLQCMQCRDGFLEEREAWQCGNDFCRAWYTAGEDE